MTDNSEIWTKLSAEFPREIISWRAQTVTKDGDKALALAYVTARDVMERLDEAVGPGNWQNRFEAQGDTTVCYLSIRIDGEWITKADGAGATDVEAEKGRLSDALKRSAVLWGVSRYLYEMPSPWVPCDVWTGQDGKHRWKAWKSDPWDYVKVAPKVQGQQVLPLATDTAKRHWEPILAEFRECKTVKQLNGAFERHKQVYELFPDHFQEGIRDEYFKFREALTPEVAPSPPAKPANPDFSNLAPNDVDQALLAKAEKAVRLGNTP